MKDILSWAGLALVFLFGTAVSTFSNHLESARVRADEAEAAEALRGFAGYAYGSGDLYIRDDLEAAGWEAVEIKDTAAWYKATMLGYPVQLGYIFDQHQLVGGAWLFLDTSEEAVDVVDDFLRDTYGGRVEITVDGNRIERIYRGPDSTIVHLHDPDQDSHEVIYKASQ